MYSLEQAGDPLGSFDNFSRKTGVLWQAKKRSFGIKSMEKKYVGLTTSFGQM